MQTATMFTNRDDWVDVLKPMTIISSIYLIVVAISWMSSDAVTGDYTHVFPDVLFLTELLIINIQIHMYLFWDWKDRTAADVDKILWKNFVKVFATPVFAVLIHTFVWIPYVTTLNFYMLGLVFKPEEGIPDGVEQRIAIMNLLLIFLLPFMIKKFINILKSLMEELYSLFFKIRNSAWLLISFLSAEEGESD